MHSSNCAEPEIMQIDTLPNHSILKSRVDSSAV